MIVSRIPLKAGPHQADTSTTRSSAADSVEGRELVPLQSPAKTLTQYAARPNASFVAHLIAMAEQDPQTRTLRRETPAVAQQAYHGPGALEVHAFGKLLSQIA